MEKEPSTGNLFGGSLDTGLTGREPPASVRKRSASFRERKKWRRSQCQSLRIDPPVTTGEFSWDRKDLYSSHDDSWEKDVLYVGEKGFWEGRVGNRNGWFPHTCVEELKKEKQRPKTLFGRAPSSLSSMFTKSDVLYHPTEVNDREFAEPARIVTLNRGKCGFGFQMRGANSETPRLNFQPTSEFPALQYIGEVEKGGEAEGKGVQCGDFILEVAGEDVTTATHTHVVDLIQRSGSVVTMKIVTVPIVEMNGMDYGREGLTYGSLRGKAPPPLPARDPSTTLTLGRMRCNGRPSLFEAGLGHSHEEPASFKVDSVIAVSKDSPWHTLQRRKHGATNSRSAAQFKFNGSTKNVFGHNSNSGLTEGQRSMSLQNICAPPSYESLMGKRPLSTAVPFPQVPDFYPHFSRTVSSDPETLSLKMELSSHSTPDLDSQRTLRARVPSPLSLNNERPQTSQHPLPYQPYQLYQSHKNSTVTDFGEYDQRDDENETVLATPVDMEESIPKDVAAVFASPVYETNNNEIKPVDNEHSYQRRHSFDSRTSEPVTLSTALQAAVAARNERMDKKRSHSEEILDSKGTGRKVSAPAVVTLRKRATSVDRFRSDIMAQLNDGLSENGAAGHGVTPQRSLSVESGDSQTERNSNNYKRYSTGSLISSGRDVIDGTVPEARPTTHARTSSFGSSSASRVSSKPPIVPKPKVPPPVVPKRKVPPPVVPKLKVPPPRPPPAPPAICPKQPKPVKPVKGKKADIPLTPVRSGLITIDALQAKKGKLKSVDSNADTPKTSKSSLRPVNKLLGPGKKPAPSLGSQHANMLAKAVAARAARLALKAQDAEHSESPSSWDDEPSDSHIIPVNFSPPKQEIKVPKKTPPPVPPKKKFTSPKQQLIIPRSEPETSPKRSLFPPRGLDSPSEGLSPFDTSSYTEEDRTMMMFDDILKREVESENWSLNSWNSSDSSSLVDVMVPPAVYGNGSEEGQYRKSSGGSGSRPWYEYSSGSPSEESLNASTERIGQRRSSYTQESKEDDRDRPSLAQEAIDSEKQMNSGFESVDHLRSSTRQEPKQYEGLEPSDSERVNQLQAEKPQDSKTIGQYLRSSYNGEKVSVPSSERDGQPTYINLPFSERPTDLNYQGADSTRSNVPHEDKLSDSGLQRTEDVGSSLPNEEELVEQTITTSTGLKIKLLLKRDRSGESSPVQTGRNTPESGFNPTEVRPPEFETVLDVVMNTTSDTGRTCQPHDYEVEECLETEIAPPPQAFTDEFTYGEIASPNLPPPPEFCAYDDIDGYSPLPAPPGSFGDFGMEPDLELPPDELDASGLSQFIDDAHSELGPPLNSESFADKAMLDWTCDDVCQWLESISLSQYIDTFRENDIQGVHLPELTKAELKELGVKSLGHRMTMENSVAKLCHPMESSC